MFKLNLLVILSSIIPLTLFSESPITESIIENARIENIDDNQYELVWDHADDQNTSYLIFGTNSSEFPGDAETLINSPDHQFLDQTTEKRLPLEPCFKFYRIVATQDGQYSEPSTSVALTDHAEMNSLLQKSSYKKITTYTPYERNPHVSDEAWNTMKPYFFPASRPEKAELDKIFSKRRVLNSLRDMEKAGFTIITNPKDKIIVAKHPKLKGLLVKVYLDAQNTVDWGWWKKRIDGVRIIQESICRHGYRRLMKTPRKWVYPLPAEPSPTQGSYRKNFVLIVEKMDILDSDKNRIAYKEKMTPALLDALYTIIMENLLIDSVYCDNTPFCKDGRLAFIDTEHVQDRSKPVPLWTIGKYLSKRMYAYWEQLIQHGVQK